MNSVRIITEGLKYLDLKDSEKIHLVQSDYIFYLALDFKKCDVFMGTVAGINKCVLGI